MKQFVLLLLAICSCMNITAQDHSLEVDCQNPGWLSNLINYSQQQQLKNLKVTGYINGLDLSFIKELCKSQRLNGVINLENANIVSGEGSTANVLPSEAFANLKHIQKIVLPLTLEKFEVVINGYTNQFLNTEVDTLVINGTMKELTVCFTANMHFWKVRCMYFPEGVESIDFAYLFYACLPNTELFLPSTLTSVTSKSIMNESQNVILHCNSTSPEDIIVTGLTNSFFDGGTICVPKGTIEKYKSSVFSKLNIIEDIAVEGIEFNAKSIDSYVNSEFTLSAYIKPSDALNQEVVYVIEDSDILENTGGNNFVGKKYGSTKVRAYSFNNLFYDICEVRIFEHTTGVDFQDEATVKVGEMVQVVASTLPVGTSDNLVVYSSSNPETAVVSNNGTVTGISQGSATITATTIDGGYVAECRVKVLQPVTSLTLSEHTASLRVGDTKSLNITIVPTYADNKSVIWSSSDDEIAKVEDGKVTAIKPGKVRIIAVAEDNEMVSDFCDFDIIQPTIGIELNYSSYIFKSIGDLLQLEANIIPEDATNKKVNWKSSNESVCIVSNGMVVAVANGTAVIIATTEDGGYLATCTITVKDATGVRTINNSNISACKIYTLDGKSSTLSTKGIKIIRLPNGNTQKMIIK